MVDVGRSIVGVLISLSVQYMDVYVQKYVLPAAPPPRLRGYVCSPFPIP